MEFIVQKIGMSRTVSVPSTAVTLLKVIDTKVCQVTDGVALVSYSSGKKFNKAIEGQQKKYNLSKEFNRFATITVANSEAGDLDVAGLGEAKIVKTTFRTKGRGFTGVVKRWNCEFPGRVQPGKKMPGQYGNTNVSVKNEVLSFDAEAGVLVLKGSVSGPNGSLGKVKVAK